jgi:hypothetical protein
MRACWLDAGENPNGVALDRHGITELCWDAHAPFTTMEKIDGWRTKYAQRIYIAQNWMPGLPPDGFADYVSARLNVLGGDRPTPNGRLGVDVNIELHDDPGWLVAFFTAWRKLRPQRDTRWLLEGIQGGWFTPALVKLINADPNLRVLAEAFYDKDGVSMLPYDPDAVRSNLVNYGIARQRAAVVYDAAKLGSYWDGVAFTQGRLT